MTNEEDKYYHGHFDCDICEKIFEDGFRAGYEEGYNEGVARGYNEGKDSNVT
jgi:flagellar biosynthesis/type III secretory pathway protein FliH